MDEGVDTGPILATERVAIHPGDTQESLHERIKKVEHKLLVETIRSIANGKIDLEKYKRG